MSSQKMFIVIFVIFMGRWEKKIRPGIPLIVARLVFGDSIWAPWRNTGHSGVSGIALWLRAAISYGWWPADYVILIFHKKLLMKYQNGMSQPSL